MHPRYPKRVFDIIVAGAALGILLPVMGAVALAVLIRLGWPIFFVQTRPGLGGRPFRLIKFRTMKPERDDLGDDERLTGFGRFLRSTSLDELPELWNVVKGDMSLVGPRPLLLHYLDHYTPVQMRRHEVRPGITGWAQVNGRNSISWDTKFEMDVWYADNISFALDIKILFLTLTRVFGRSGISAEGFATMPEFARRTPQDTSAEPKE